MLDISKYLLELNKMRTGDVEKFNDVMFFFNTIWSDDDQKEFFVKFEDGDSCYQLLLNDDNSFDIEEFDEDEILELLEFHSDEALDEWNSFYSWR